MRNFIQVPVQQLNSFTFLKAICLSLLLFLCITEAKAQNTVSIKGTIFCNMDKSPLPGVSIVLNNSIRGTETDLSGKFEFENLNIGDQITIYSMGYAKKTITVSNSLQPLNIYLKEDGEVIDTVHLGANDTKSTYKAKRGFWKTVTSIF